MAKTLNQNQGAILNRFQRNFPLVPRPFAEMANELGLSEDVVLSEIVDLRSQDIIGRVGATVRPNRAGSSTLVAIAVPEDRLEQVAEIVSAQPEVNHNYEREHKFNLWFVVTTGNAAALADVLRRIEALTGLPVLNLPLETPYHIDLGFAV
ncbi:MAG: hypothetical protein K8F25_15015 [Fimbriimonadaceae bacterium]|nr:hypothetical protein [Alphaproteobacteria bacterium]